MLDRVLLVYAVVFAVPNKVKHHQAEKAKKKDATPQVNASKTQIQQASATISRFIFIAYNQLYPCSS